MNWSDFDEQCMRAALDCALRVVGMTRPNPTVGCVIAKQGSILSQGATRPAGESHAEIVALKQLTPETTHGATLYVTLEPCSHSGRTPPCVDAVIEAGIKRVVVAMTDPNPDVNGQGIERLANAQVQVDIGLMADQAEALNGGFFKRMRCGLPRLTLKSAMSLDGRTAMADGESQWITGPDARADVHRLRARSCAIVTGRGTVVTDDPSLTARGLEPAPDGYRRLQPAIVLLDSTLQVSPDAKIFTTGAPVHIFHARGVPAESVDSLQNTGATLHAVDPIARGLDLRQVLKRLGTLDFNEVMVEAGATLGGQLLNAKLVDRLFVYIAPILLGSSARGLFELPEIQKMDDKVRLKLTQTREFGPDLRLTLHPEQ